MINIAKEENVEVTALEDPKNLECGDAARKLATNAVEVITEKPNNKFILQMLIQRRKQSGTVSPF